MILASILVIPVSTSYATSDNSSAFTTSGTPMSNQTNTNMTMPASSTPSVNQTTTNQTSQTIAQPSSSIANNTQTAQQISDFVHQAVAHFKQQKDETHQVIFACRDQLQNASSTEIDKIHAGCTTQLSAIKAKYQDERNHLHDLIKQYRESMMVFLNDARGLTVDKASMDKAFAHLNSMMHMTIPSGGMPGHVTGLMATKNNTRCVNPPGGPAIC